MDKFVIFKKNKIPEQSDNQSKTEKEILINRDGALVEFYPKFLQSPLQDKLFLELKNLDNWRFDKTLTRDGLKQTHRMVMGMSRSEQDIIDNEFTKKCIPFIPILLPILDRIEEITGETFNFAYLNLYRDGEDHIGWHADKEGILAPGSTIASLSLGASRDFLLRHINETRIAQEIVDPKLRREALNKARKTVLLKSGSLLLMRGRTQQVYHHHVPKRKGIKDVRINITFRKLISLEKKN